MPLPAANKQNSLQHSTQTHRVDQIHAYQKVQVKLSKMIVTNWMCDNHPCNGIQQLRDHIEGAGEGGKSHMKMRKRWLEANQPLREQWLKMLADGKKDTKVTSTSGAVEVLTSPPAHTKIEFEVATKTYNPVSNYPLPVDAYLYNRNDQQQVTWSNGLAPYECWQHIQYMAAPNLWPCQWQ